MAATLDWGESLLTSVTTNTMTRHLKSTVGVSPLITFELGQRWWMVGFTTGLGQRPRTRRVAAGGIDVVLTEVARANTRFGLPEATPVISCYEAVATFNSGGAAELRKALGGASCGTERSASCAGLRLRLRRDGR